MFGYNRAIVDRMMAEARQIQFQQHQAIRQLEHERETLRSQLKAANSAATKAKKELKELKDELRETEEELYLHQDHVEELEGELEAIKSEEGPLREIARMEYSRGRLEQKLETADERRRDAELRARESEKDLERERERRVLVEYQLARAVGFIQGLADNDEGDGERTRAPTQGGPRSHHEVLRVQAALARASKTSISDSARLSAMEIVLEGSGELPPSLQGDYERLQGAKAIPAVVVGSGTKTTSQAKGRPAGVRAKPSGAKTTPKGKNRPKKVAKKSTRVATGSGQPKGKNGAPARKGGRRS